jgi:hypothetical protein
VAALQRWGQANILIEAYLSAIVAVLIPVSAPTLQPTVCNQHTLKYEQLLKAWQNVQDGKKATPHWLFLKPELRYEGVQPLCGRRCGCGGWEWWCWVMIQISVLFVSAPLVLMPRKCFEIVRYMYINKR